MTRALFFAVILSTLATGCPKGAAISTPGGANALVGTWADESGQITVIAKSGKALAVTNIVDSDGEVFEVKRYEVNEAGQFGWQYHVPSTGYLVDYRVTNVNGDTLDFDWSNDHDAAGSEAMFRQ